MPPTSGERSLSEFVAGELRRRAGPCTDEWIDVLRRQLSVRPAKLLPDDSVRDHIPLVIEEIAEQLRHPDQPFDPEAVESLRRFAELRRQQGYHESEVLAELGTLHLCIFAEFVDALTGFRGGADAAAVAALTGRLQGVLDDVDRIVVGVLRERERQESRELSRRLADFTKALMHELRDPLNAATQSARMLDNDDIEDDGHFAESVVRNLEKVERLLSDLSMVENVESARAQGRWIHLPKVVDEVLGQTSEEARNRGVLVELESDVPDVVVDAGAVEIPLRNLVWNAVKYSDPDKERRWVRIAVRPLGEGSAGTERWRISVADNGIGIPEEHHDQVFERRFRADRHVAEGTGLGLSIARQMASQRGGRIWFESVEGEGSTFHLEVREQLEDSFED